MDHLKKSTHLQKGVPDLENEIWIHIDGYENLYLVSNMGRVKRHGFNKLLKPQKNNKGYHVVRLSKYGEAQTFTIHRLVALTFKNNPYNLPIVNHKNRIRTDNRAENLEWATHQENSDHASRTIYNNNERQLSYSEVFQIHEMERLGFSFMHISKCFEIPNSATARILNGHSHNLESVI